MILRSILYERSLYLLVCKLCSILSIKITNDTCYVYGREGNLEAIKHANIAFIFHSHDISFFVVEYNGSLVHTLKK